MKEIEISALVLINTSATDVEILARAYGEELDALGRGWEMIFILDGVTEPALGTLRRLQEEGLPVQAISLQSTHGETAGYKAAAEKARGAYLLTLPAYLQVDPKEIHTLVDELDRGAHLVTTVRHPRVDPWINRLQSTLFNSVIRLIITTRFHDLNCNFRGLRREVIEEITIYGEMYRFLPVMAERQGFKVREVRVRHCHEMGKKGYFGLGVYIRRFLDILTVVFLARFTQKPLRFFGFLGMILIMVGLALAADPVIGKIMGQGVQDRPLFLIAVTIFTFGLQLIGFGLVGEIIIFTQSRHLREYRVEKVLEAREPAVPGTLHLPAGSPPARGVGAGGKPIIRLLAPGEDARWDRYVRAHRRGTPFHLSGWRRVVTETFDHDPVYLLAESEGRIRGVLPLFKARCFTEGLRRRLVYISIPYAVYGGILADDRRIEESLLAEASGQVEAAGAQYLEIRENEDRGYDLRENGIYATFLKDLPADPEEVLGGIPRKARAEARKGIERHDLRINEARDLATFHRLFAVNKRYLGSPSLPLRFFTALEEEYGNGLYLHIVSLPSGKPLAGVISFAWKDLVMPYYSGSLKEYENLGINNFMYWGLMRWAVEQGFRRFDFGRSRVDTGAYRFKKHMGFEPRPLAYRYLLVKAKRVPSFHPSNPKTSLVRNTWSRFPLFLTTWLGGRLSRYLP